MEIKIARLTDRLTERENEGSRECEGGGREGD